MHHPDAFASLDQAFDPAANAAYAARFLRQLYGQAGAWPKAVAAYHSATPALAVPYAQKVMAVWPEEAGRPAGATLGHGYGVPYRRDLPAAVGAASKGLDLYRSRPIGVVTRLRRQFGRF